MFGPRLPYRQVLPSPLPITETLPAVVCSFRVLLGKRIDLMGKVATPDPLTGISSASLVHGTSAQRRWSALLLQGAIAYHLSSRGELELHKKSLTGGPIRHIFYHPSGA
jgi:hypothetical protein